MINPRPPSPFNIQHLSNQKNFKPVQDAVSTQRGTCLIYFTRDPTFIFLLLMDGKAISLPRKDNYLKCRCVALHSLATQLAEITPLENSSIIYQIKDNRSVLEKSGLLPSRESLPYVSNFQFN